MNKTVVVGITAVLAGTAGFVAGYVYCDKKMLRVYDEQMTEEVAQIRHHYKTLYKGDEFATPESAAEHLLQNFNPEDSKSVQTLERVAQGLKAQVDYTKPPRQKSSEWFEPKQEPTEEITEEEVVRVAVALEETPDPDKPYLVPRDVFFQNENNYQQVTLTWYAADSVLVDENDAPIEKVDAIVGTGNMDRFGHLSGDRHVAYVRNDRLGMDFEVIESQASYKEVVLGMQN